MPVAAEYLRKGALGVLGVAPTIPSGGPGHYESSPVRKASAEEWHLHPGANGPQHLLLSIHAAPGGIG